MENKQDCIFCKIINKEIKSAIVYEDKDVIAFLDIAPVHKGHTLIVPKKHSDNFILDSEDDLKKVIIIAKKLAKGILKATNADGINLINNCMPAAGQVVMHTHFHLIPRFKNDGLKHWPQGKYNENEMPFIKEKIIQEIDKED
ncbi:MAG: HIT family protein [Candidatus Woesearchaeota archaeon]